MSVKVINPIVEQPKVAPVEEDLNYLILIQKVVGKMLDQLNRISEKNRLQTEQQKRTYTKANQEWSEHQRALGNIGWYSTGATFGFMILPILLKGYVDIPKADKPFLDLLTKKAPDNIANMFSSKKQAEQQMVRSQADLAMNEMNLSANKSANDASTKDQVIGLLDRAYEGQRRAAQSG